MQVDTELEKRRMKFGQLFQKHRKQAKVTQAQFEEKIGKMKNTATRYENGMTQMGVQDFETGLAMLDVDVDLYDFFPLLNRPDNEKASVEDVIKMFKGLSKKDKKIFMSAVYDDAFDE